MSGLDAIKVTVESTGCGPADALNAVPLLHEIRHALMKLAQDGETTTIDLSSIPFGPGDKEQLLDVLGKGEVDATVDAMGDTRIQETRYSGVWLIQYFAVSGEALATHIEVTRCPSLLVTPNENLVEAAEALAARLAQ